MQALLSAVIKENVSAVKAESSYYLQAAEAQEQGKKREVENCEKAARLSKSAQSHFRSAFGHFLSSGDHTQALQQAEKKVGKELTSFRNFEAAKDWFERRNKEEGEAQRQLASYNLKEAKALADDDETKAHNFRQAALVAGSAVKFFGQAAEPKITEEKKETLKRYGATSLVHAKLWASQDRAAA